MQVGKSLSPLFTIGTNKHTHTHTHTPTHTHTHCTQPKKHNTDWDYSVSQVVYQDTSTNTAVLHDFSTLHQLPPLCLLNNDLKHTHTHTKPPPPCLKKYLPNETKVHLSWPFCYESFSMKQDQLRFHFVYHLFIPCLWPTSTCFRSSAKHIG